MTQPGSRVGIATIQTMMVYSLSLAPLASFNRWRGWTTTGPFHQRMLCLIDLFAGKAYIPHPVGWQGGPRCKALSVPWSGAT